MDETNTNIEQTATEQTATEQTATETPEQTSGQPLTDDAMKIELEKLKEENTKLREMNTKLITQGTGATAPQKSVEETIYDVFKGR